MIAPETNLLTLKHDELFSTFAIKFTLRCYIMDRRIFRNDYIRLRHAAAVSTLAEGDDSTLLTVLSLRWQAFHVLRLERCRQRRGGAGAGSSAGAGITGDGGAGAGAGGSGGGDVIGSGGGAMNVDDEGEDDAFEEAARFVDVRAPIGAHCAPDDDAPLADADRAERAWLAGAAAEVGRCKLNP